MEIPQGYEGPENVSLYPFVIHFETSVISDYTATSPGPHENFIERWKS